MIRATFLCVPYLLVHTILAVCCYREWLAPRITHKNKELFEYHILLNFIIVNALPLTDFKWTVFGMVPVLLIGTYMQAVA